MAVPTRSSAMAAPRASTTAASSSSSSVSVPLTATIHPSKVSTKRLTGHTAQVRALAWNADGRRLASGSVDKTLRVWIPEKDIKTSVEYRGHTGDVSCVRWNPTHLERLASSSSTTGDKKLHFWDLRQGGRPTGTVETEGNTIQMSWSPDGKTIVLGNTSDVISWIDVDTQKVVQKTKMKGETNEAVFSHNGSLLLTAVEGTVEIKAFPSGEFVHRVQVSPAPTTVLDLDPRGRFLAAGSNDTTLTLWETTEWTCVSTSGLHDDPIRACRFSHDGQFLASASHDPEVIITQVPSLKKFHSIKTGASVDTLAWHPEKHLLAYASKEIEADRTQGAIRIWGL